MNFKKILFVFSALAFSFFIAKAENVSYFEVSNNEICTSCAKEIAASSETEAIGLIQKGNSVLCGIITEDKTKDQKILKDYCTQYLKTVFKGIKKCVIEVNTSKAVDIIELSYYSSGDIKKHILRARFDFLLLQD